MSWRTCSILVEVSVLGNVATDDPHCPAGVGTEEVDGEEGGVFPQSELALAGATVHEIITSHYPNLLS